VEGVLEGRFLDRVVITVRAGKGGDGLVAFRREACVPKGGPSGGAGGRGGSVWLQVDPKLSTLADFINGSFFRAENGTPGGRNNMTGAGGGDLVLKIPPGTEVYDNATGELLSDMTEPGQKVLIASGGAPGLGNASFATPSRRTPRIRTRGEPGKELKLRFDLKLMADAGLVGFPNAGKSTLLSRISAARPKTADYPFTTLSPSLGVVRISSGFSFTVADLPGLLSGASRGVGLGLRFLRHAERNRILVFVLSPDLSVTPDEQLEVLRKELTEYGTSLVSARAIAVLSKCDTITKEQEKQFLEKLPNGTIPLSSATGRGVQVFLQRLGKLILQLRKTDSEPSSPLPSQEKHPGRNS
jgi:GTP-binding protein